MKKTLLVCSLIAGSCFFALAQFQVGDTKINVGQVAVPVGNNQVIVNPSTGQVQVNTPSGGVRVNTQTGQVGVNGTVGGVKVGVGIAGGSANGSNSYISQGGLLGLIGLAQFIAARLVPLLIGLAVLAFFWFLILFIWKASDNPDEQAKLKKGMFYSILALFVMVSIWGIIAFIGYMFGIQQGGNMPGFKLPGEQ